MLDNDRVMEFVKAEVRMRGDIGEDGNVETLRGLDDHGVDSLSAYEVLLAVEDEFNVDVGIDALSAGSIESFVHQCCQGKPRVR